MQRLVAAVAAVAMLAAVSFGGIVVSGGGGVSPSATNQVLQDANTFTTNVVASYLPIVSTNSVQITGSLSVNGTNVLGTAGGTNVYNTIVTNTYVSNSYSFAVSSTYTGTVVNGMLRLADDAGAYRASGQWESPTITSASGFTGLTMSVLSQYALPVNSPYSGQITNGLVAYYKMDGSAKDEITGSNGTIVGSGSYQSEAIFGSGSYSNQNSNNQNFTTVGSNLLNGATGSTFSVWIRMIASPQAYGGILEARGSRNTGIHAQSTNLFYFELNGGGGAGSTATFTNQFGTGTWQHLCVAWSTNSPIKCFVNGTLLTENSSKYVGSITNDDFFKIGQNDAAVGTIVNGLFDDVRIYDRPLSDQEVATLYANSSAHRAQVSLNGGTYNGPDGTTNSYYTSSTAFGATQTQAKVRVELSKSSVSNTTPRIYNLAMLNAGGGATVFDTVADFAQGSFTNTLVDTEPAFPTNMAYVTDVVAATNPLVSLVYVTNLVNNATNVLSTNSVDWTFVMTSNTYDWTEANLIHDGTNYCLPLPAYVPNDAREIAVAFIAACASPSAGVGLTVQPKWTAASNTPTAYFPRFPVFPQVANLTLAGYAEFQVIDHSMSYRSNIPASGRTASIKILKWRR